MPLVSDPVPPHHDLRCGTRGKVNTSLGPADLIVSHLAVSGRSLRAPPGPIRIFGAIRRLDDKRGLTR